MQKLVKRRMHYETIMPVEAYEGEEKDDDWETEIGLGLTAAGIIVEGATYLGFISNPVGHGIGFALGMGAIANAALHNEELMEDIGESSVVQAQASVAMGAAINNAIQSTGDAIMGGIIDFVGGIDQGDPMVQLYGE